MKEEFFLVNNDEQTEFDSFQSLLEQVKTEMNNAPKHHGKYSFTVKLRTIIDRRENADKTYAFCFDDDFRGVI